MKDSTKKILLIGGSILAIGGVVYYFYYKSKKKKEKEAADALAAQLAAQQAQQSGGGVISTPSGGGSQNPFSTKADLLAFQQWVINTKKDKTILGSGGASGYGDDGVWGAKALAAWNKYGEEYSKGSSPAKVDEANLTIDQKYAKIPSSILQYYWNVVKDPAYTGVISKNELIESLYNNPEYHSGYTARDYMKDWSNTLDKHNASSNKQKHTWWKDGNTIYDIFDGRTHLSPIDKTAVVKAGGVKKFSDPRFTNVGISFLYPEGTKLGVMKNAVFVKGKASNGANRVYGFYYIPGDNFPWVIRDKIIF
jgi:type II secretory pathway pseudopilin PulG